MYLNESLQYGNSRQKKQKIKAAGKSVGLWQKQSENIRVKLDWVIRVSIVMLTRDTVISRQDE